MTLDRETARALFGDAPAPAAAPVGGAPYAAAADTPTFAENSIFERMQGLSARKSKGGLDWRLAAPVGVAALCIGAIALFALPRNDPAVEGRTVAATDIAAPPVAPAAPLIPAPVETAAATPLAEPVSEPVVRRAASTPRPAARRPATRTTAAVAPSASEAGVNVSTSEPAAPPPPSLGAPATVTLQPAAPAVTPPPATPPIVEPQPQPLQ